jgi:hypothetical protein
VAALQSKDKYTMHQKTSDHEASMAKAELAQIAKNALAVYKMIQDGDEIDGWVSSYITLANDHLNSVQEHMEYEIEKRSSIEHGPREFEESLHYTVKSSLCEQWLDKKYQGR